MSLHVVMYYHGGTPTKYGVIQTTVLTDSFSPFIHIYGNILTKSCSCKIGSGRSTDSGSDDCNPRERRHGCLNVGWLYVCEGRSSLKWKETKIPQKNHFIFDHGNHSHPASTGDEKSPNKIEFAFTLHVWLFNENFSKFLPSE